jgi:hypothetical protein
LEASIYPTLNFLIVFGWEEEAHAQVGVTLHLVDKDSEITNLDNVLGSVLVDSLIIYLEDLVLL